jgi:3-dehydroquinate synthetase
VAWGIAAAVELSRGRAGLAEGDAARVLRTLSRLGPFPPASAERDRIARFLERDKKSTARGIAGVLLERVGSARVVEGVSVDAWVEAAGRMSIP